MRLILFLLVLYSAEAFSQTATTAELHFPSGSPELTAATKRSIDSLLHGLDQEKTEILSVKINGHCDEEGDLLKNQSLSVKRARAVYDYLDKKGIDKSRMSYKGFGKTRPKYSRSAADKSKNRRTELVIIAKAVPPPPAPPPAAKKPAPSAPAPPPAKKEPINNFSKDSLVIGKTIQLKDMNFFPGSARLLPSARPSLEELVRLMKENPGLVIEIDGHVCCDDAMKLSVARAFEVYSTLVSAGIKEERLSYKGFSNSRPLVPERTEQDRIRNRRVEIKVLKR